MFAKFITQDHVPRDNSFVPEQGKETDKISGNRYFSGKRRALRGPAERCTHHGNPSVDLDGKPGAVWSSECGNCVHVCVCARVGGGHSRGHHKSGRTVRLWQVRAGKGGDGLCPSGLGVGEPLLGGSQQLSTNVQPKWSWQRRRNAAGKMETLVLCWGA